MNFLAHLHLAYLAESSLLGNLVADFVKGNPYQYYPSVVADGVMMHRRVDKMTDSLPAVKTARSLFSQEHYRISPITLDVVWDHFLARHWQQLETHFSLPDFNHWAEKQIEPSISQTPAEFQRLNQYLWQERWLENYADLSFIAKVLRGMANRRPRLASLATSINDVEQNYDTLEQTFRRFYPDMIAQAKLKSL